MCLFFNFFKELSGGVDMKMTLDIEVDNIAVLFSKTLRSLPIEGYGIRKLEGFRQWKRR